MRRLLALAFSTAHIGIEQQMHKLQQIARGRSPKKDCLPIANHISRSDRERDLTVNNLCKSCVDG